MSNTDIKWGSSYDDGRESQARLNVLLTHTLNDRAFDSLDQPTLLDLGANAGYFSKGMADAGFSVTAIEPPNGKKLEHPGVTEYRHWVQAPEDLPEGNFDYAIVFSVLHHIPRWRDVLEAVISKTNRIVYVEIPHAKESHHKWHGSRDQLTYLSHMEGKFSEVIGSHYEVSQRYKRDMWAVDTRVR